MIFFLFLCDILVANIIRELLFFGVCDILGKLKYMIHIVIFEGIFCLFFLSSVLSLMYLSLPFSYLIFCSMSAYLHLRVDM